MRILITGGAGFIGSALGAHLIETQNAEVVAYDNLLEQVHPAGVPQGGLHASINLVKEDVRDRDAWRTLFSDYRPDYIVHFAAETGTAQSLTESSRHTSVNVTGTSEMLDALVHCGHKPSAFLLSSSRSIYGEGAWQAHDGGIFYPGQRSNRQLSASQWDFTGPDGNIARALPHEAGKVFPNPTSIYGSTKLAQEHVLNAWCNAFNVPLRILRFQNVYGVGQSPFNPYTGIINIFHKMAYAGQPIPVYEDGAIGRDFVYVDDVVTACSAALLSNLTGTVTYDVGYGSVTTILDAARMIAAMHDAPEPQICGKFRDGDVRWAVANTAPLERDLGVKAGISFETGARLVGNWLIERGLI